MKIKLTLLIALGCLMAYGQSDDDQWIIENESYVGNFYINEMSPPCLDCNSNADNDLFIIYDNGTHYNSRNVSGTIPAVPTSSDTVVRIIDNPSNVNYMYLTNKYEGDDWPPPTVSGLHTGGSQDYSIGISQPDSILTANHDIVRGKDITLVLNVSELYDEVKDSISHMEYLRIYFNEVIPRSASTGTGVVQNAFSPSKVFRHQGSGYKMYFPHHVNYIDNTTGAVSFLDVSCDALFADTSPSSGVQMIPYFYINLRPSDALNPYYPVENDSYDYSMNFRVELLDATKNYVMDISEPLIEKIRDSHDPNFIKVESINKCNADYYICYHAQVKNTSYHPVGSFTIDVFLPDNLDYECIDVKEIGPSACRKSSPIPIVDGNHISFEFQKCQLMRCKDNHVAGNEKDDISVGYVKFCVKAEGLSQDPAETDWRASSGNTEFDGRPYDINDYFGLPCREKPNEEKKCTRPVRNECDFRCGPVRKPKRCLFRFLHKEKYKVINKTAEALNP